MNKIFFVTGVNGVGKSTIIPYLKSILPEDNFIVYDFDARGVPPDADRKWRISETKYWISEGKRLSEDKTTVICGFVKPSDLQEYDLINNESPEIVLILLYAKPEIIKQRLIRRYTNDGIFDESQKVIGKPIDKFINGNVWFAEQIKIEFEKSGFSIIDTSSLIPEEVAKEVVNIISTKEDE
jgi:adenylate kinase